MALDAILNQEGRSSMHSVPTLLELADATNLSIDALQELEAP